ncbi:hypothetical protein CONPUDRAFT_158340 [Coniophora puteana RWD-64-598 SS2]|uniref:VWFA domain-containing protein n=1 Tax=Coniophora puteana (strain RWD-64-598) TaxID=741705 RepID=A0A5M3MBP9_CONPW|nr:uncharacterized protein CONPUDRAFT_158340 [Coniophora puteana RWD-64-598 SS2]EIW76314.1 hypothetical protein CONPUDRAFT_158340 [Coniophora puteana RWD-64-598 SS2]
MGHTSSKSDRRNYNKSGGSYQHPYGAPPPYSDSDESLDKPPSVPPKDRRSRRPRQENALEILRRYDTVLIVDDSTSMRGALWHEAREALADLAKAAATYDTDGIDICFLNSKEHGEGLKEADEVRDIFNRVKPTFGTPLGVVVHKVLKRYLKRLEREIQRDSDADEEVKPVNYIVITDGRPDDEIELENAIVKCATFLDKHEYPLSQIGIQFVQIGDDLHATQFLKDLDNTLATKYTTRDIVDTETYNGVVTAPKLIKLMLGGINRRVDMKGGEVML